MESVGLPVMVVLVLGVFGSSECLLPFSLEVVRLQRMVHWWLGGRTCESFTAEESNLLVRVSLIQKDVTKHLFHQVTAARSRGVPPGADPVHQEFLINPGILVNCVLYYLCNTCSTFID